MSTVRRAAALIVLAGVRDVEGFELDLAARTLAAGWSGDIRQLLDATGAVMALRAAAGTGQGDRYPQLGYLTAVERELAGRGVAVLCREVDRPSLGLHGRLTVDLARVVGAHPETRMFAAEWSTERGWTTVTEAAGRRSRHWFDGLLPEPGAVADRIVRHLDGDMAVPRRRAWRHTGGQLLEALGRHQADDVPVVCRTDPDWRQELFQRRLLTYDPPPVPLVGAEVHLPDLPTDRRRVVAVLPQPPGDEDLYWVRLEGCDFPISWDAAWRHLG
ncbi:hypothetical protein [Dactylosporangium sp. NPDC005555]|uniref:DUF6292 family protein n=1 Tax=Dactylosporangium sp. NPDC005555 TaxID=3154889 RepID=UPI0033B2E4B4